MANPEDLKIEVFHQVCPQIQAKIAELVAEVNEAIQFCRGENAEATPFLPALADALFGRVCKLNKEQVVCE